METKYTFACAINCMDGRIQDAVKDYIKETYKVTCVDMVTEPGPNKILADNTDTPIIEDIKKRVGISINNHHAAVIAIVGHFGCAGNPVEKEQQISDLQQAKKTVESFGFNSEIILLWVDADFSHAQRV